MTEKIDIKDYRITDQDILVDLRDRTVFNFGTIPGAVNIPVDEIDKLYLLPQSKRIVLFCQKGEISSDIADLLDENGFKTAELLGGYREYLKNNMLLQIN